MKKLFLILLLGNIVFYLWATNIQPKPDVNRALTVDPALQQIVLLEEVEQKAEEQKKQSGSLASAISSKPSVRELEPKIVVKQNKKVTPLKLKKQVCFYTRPFEKRQPVEMLQGVLAKRAIQSEIVINKVAVNVGYWVMYPAAANMKEARANVKFLKDKGVKDYWLFRKGEQKGAISLGMFKEVQRAEKIQKGWAKKGVKLEIKPRITNQEWYVLKILSNRQVSELNNIVNKISEVEIEINLQDKRCN